MQKRNEKLARRIGLQAGSLLIVGAGLVGCGGPSSSDGVVANEIPLPTDTLLNLACADVGINLEQCVLDDPENPFRGTATREFDANDPDAETKFDLAVNIPAGPAGAKSRFYLWATAQARAPKGENQYFTALALHELYTVNDDPIIREQALRAYRSVWENFFGSVTVFECCGTFFPFPREDIGIATPLNEEVLERLLRAAEFVDDQGFYPNGFEPLIPDDPDSVNRDPGLIFLETLDVITSWGFNFTCTMGPNLSEPPCFVSVSVF